MKTKLIKNTVVAMLALSLVFSVAGTSDAKTAQYKGKTVSYYIDMGTVPYGATNYLEVCTAWMKYPESIKLKVDATVSATKNGSKYTVTGAKSVTSDTLKKQYAFDTPGYDINHFKGDFTINGSKTYKIDTNI